MQDFLGTDAIAVLSVPMAGEAFRLVPTVPGRVSDPERTNIGVITARREMSPALGERIAGVFVNPRSYTFTSPDACEFEPTHALRFEGLTNTLEILLSFRCRTLRVVLYSEEGLMLWYKTSGFRRARQLNRLLQAALAGEAAPLLSALSSRRSSGRRR